MKPKETRLKTKSRRRKSVRGATRRVWEARTTVLPNAKNSSTGALKRRCLRRQHDSRLVVSAELLKTSGVHLGRNEDNQDLIYPDDVYSFFWKERVMFWCFYWFKTLPFDKNIFVESSWSIITVMFNKAFLKRIRLHSISQLTVRSFRKRVPLTTRTTPFSSPGRRVFDIRKHRRPGLPDTPWRSSGVVASPAFRLQSGFLWFHFLFLSWFHFPIPQNVTLIRDTYIIMRQINIIVGQDAEMERLRLWVAKSIAIYDKTNGKSMSLYIILRQKYIIVRQIDIKVRLTVPRTFLKKTHFCPIFLKGSNVPSSRFKGSKVPKLLICGSRNPNLLRDKPRNARYFLLNTQICPIFFKKP